jgi:hypothetical protein
VAEVQAVAVCVCVCVCVRVCGGVGRQAGQADKKQLAANRARLRYLQAAILAVHVRRWQGVRVGASS